MNIRRALGLLVLVAAFGISGAARSATFPLRASANGRYLEDQNGTPFPILGRAYWGVIGLSEANYQTAIQDWVAKGGNAIEFRAPNASEQDNFVPRAGNGQLPFTTKVGGGTYTGAFSEDPDFTTPNESYWTFLDGFIEYCEQQGVVVLWFPLYIGYDASEGWRDEYVANGNARMQTYGAYVANRYKNRKNIIWLLGGDLGTSSNPWGGSQEIAAEQAFINGLKSVAGQQSVQYTAEWASGSFGDDEPNFGDELTLNGVYSFSGETPRYARAGYADSPTKPTFLLEEPYDEEGSDGTGKNGNAVQPVRRFVWWAILNCIGGYMAGNGYLIHFFPGYTAHFSVQGQVDLANLNTFWKSISWYQLVPSGLAGMKTLITTGGGSVGSSGYVASAATPDGRLLVAYAAPTGTASRSFSVDMTAMSAPARARWFNPTTGSYTDIATAMPNSGTHQFSTPGNNGTNANDWVLVLDTDAKTPSAPTNLQVQ